jgi:diacylglycerol kinase family enzyme
MENKNTDRLIVVHNPNSTRADRVGRDVFDVLNRNGVDYTEHITESDNISENIRAMAARFTHAKEQGERFTALNVGGDGTYLQMVNAAIESGAKVTTGSMHGGNFGDAVRMYKSQSVLDIIYAETVQAYPLTVEIDGQLWLHVPSYVTLGWTAGAAAQFGDPKSRERMKAAPQYMKLPLSLVQLLGNYIKNSKTTLPRFRVDGSSEVRYDTTDVMVANNTTIGRIVKFPVDYGLEPDVFGVNADIKVSDKGRSALFAVRAVLGDTPHDQVDQLCLLFEKELQGESPKVRIQADGEFVEVDADDILIYKNPANALPVLDARL